MNDDARDEFEIYVDGRAVPARPGDSVAAALWNAGVRRLRTSVDGQARSWLCAMGSCFECQVLIDNRPQRACVTPCRPRMTVALDTGDSAAADNDD